MDKQELEQSLIENQASTIRHHQETNTRLASEWLEGLDRPTRKPATTDAKECIQRIDLLTPNQKDQSQWILASDPFRTWLKSPQSSILEIELQTLPDSLENPLSLTSALFTTTLTSTEEVPILSFFARHRNNASKMNEKSTPLALVTSLNAQLVTYLVKHYPTVDLASTEKEGLLSRQSKKRLKDGLKLLKALLWSLPAGGMVFIVIDGHSRLSGKQKDANKVVEKLKRVVTEREDVVFKVVITDPLAGSVVNKVADLSLFVEDVVPGGGEIDPDESAGEISRVLERRGGESEGGSSKSGSDEGSGTSSSEEEGETSSGDSDGHSD